MKTSLSNKKKQPGVFKKALVFLLFFTFISVSMLTPVKPAKAQMVVTDIPKLVWDKVQDVVKTLWRKGGSIAFQQTLRSALNKMAYDTANWIGSGGEGQKPLFVTQDWGSYMAQIGDEAAGTFLENFSANLSVSREDGSGMTFNYCQPSSLDAKLKISLGLAQQNRPQGPACTASKMINNWSTAAKKFADYKDPNFLDKFVDVFDPVSGDMGIYWQASTDMMAQKIEGEKKAETTLLGKGGWLDPLTIDDKPVSLPNQAQLEIEGQYQSYSENFNKYTGDAFVDAANIFLNQLAISAFNKLVQNIGKKTNVGNNASDSFSDSFEADPNFSGGEDKLKQATTKLVQPNFGVRADYSILSELSICPDPQNPGPSNCVIDNKFMQAISEQKTVVEALEEGYLNGNWQFQPDSSVSGYQNSYTWRNVSILRKYRIVPASWELVFQKIQQYNSLAEQEPENNYGTKSATLMDLVSCYSPYDEYSQFSANFDANDQAWCTGLVDPKWVLKAPLNYCAKQGISSQIINKYVVDSQPAYGDNPYIPSSITITRAENYCADNQTCIKEGDDGSCIAYGYCNEEKRTWSFDGDSCEPINNTCQAFVNPSTGKNVAYLQNTLDYEGCSADNAGCKQYSNYGTYNPEVGTVSWNTNDSLYFNNKLEDCSSRDEGCSEFIRVKPSWGNNLVMNSNFIIDQVGASSTGAFLNEWPIEVNGGIAEIVDSFDEPGNNNGKALKLSGSTRALVYSDRDDSLVPDNFDLVPGQAYTVSADVYLDQGSSVVISLGTGTTKSSYESDISNAWHHISVTKVAGDALDAPEFSIAAYGNSGATFYVKNIKFEMSGWDTGFTSYASNKSYQKILPEYLESSCYVGETADGYSYQFKDNAPGQCYDYSRRCDQGEVGCQIYQSERADFAVPAKVASTDYCDAQCVGYDIYVARETQFNSVNSDNIIPERTTSCSAEAVGCNEFTNLDDLATGGENKEYYSALKHCVKPGQETCANFYSWETTETGSQLRSFTLQANTFGAPAVISDDSSECNETIYNAPINSPVYNPDCREFYDTEGDVYYHLNSRVITCSEDCRAYRITDKNYDTSLTQAQCSGDDRSWDSQEGACVLCINGGTWSENHNSCVYQGIPGEGKTCRASESGCREYNGSAGNNVRLLASYDFESNSSIWTSNCTNGISISDVSNEREGHSLFYNNSASSCSDIGDDRQLISKKTPLIKRIFAGDNMAAQLRVGPFVDQGKAYNVKFWASSSAGADLKVYFYNPDTQEKAEFNMGETVRVASGGGWQLYSANLMELDHVVANNEVLVITANNDFYLDNFILTEVVDRYYLIQGSSEIPDVCYYDIFDEYQGADYNLGCQAYTDREGNTHNLHSFSSICDSSAVGCEQVVSTGNYNPYRSGIWGDENGNNSCDTNEESCVEVERDKAMYLVYNPENQCGRENLGCSRLGEGVAGTSGSAWSDVFKKNNPNQYDEIMCSANSLGCETWNEVDSSGLSYFRNPGDNVCVYRSSVDQPSGQKNWYKAPVKRCDVNGDGIISGGEQSSSVCDNDNDCGASSCIIDNNDYTCDVSYLKTIGYGGDGNRIPVPVNQAALCGVEASGCQEYIDPVSEFNADLSAAGNSISLQPHTLYVLATNNEVDESASAADLGFASEVVTLNYDNVLTSETDSIDIGGNVRSVIFNSLSNNEATLNGDAAVREIAIDYQISDDIDTSSCNGITDFDNGCILFNERVAGVGGYVDLSNGFNAYKSQDGSAAVSCDSSVFGSCNSNKLIKVRPDRTCASWLDCSTYAYDEATGEKVCYDISQCNSLNEQGECNNFLTDDYEPELQNATGYYLLNKFNISEMDEVGLNSNIHYSFEELIPSIHCVRKDAPDQPCSFDNNIVKDLIIREPENARVEYPVAGKSYIKIPSAYTVSPMAYGSYVNLSEDQDYYLSYLVNTKNSSGDASITIQAAGGDAMSFRSSSPNGWERRIHRFSTETGDYDRILVFLSSFGDTEGEVYFDDINIEPVLKMSDNQYAARDCRLYPNSDSLSCRDYNKDVISQGLEGYCLEYDKDNPDVCQTWYPVDKISSSLGGTALGYNGVNGLSYCTNINSNIKFAKKVDSKRIYFNIDESRGTFMGGTWDSCPDDWNDPNNGYNVCTYCQSYPLTTSTIATCTSTFDGLTDLNEDGRIDQCTSCADRAGWAGAVNMNTDGCAYIDANNYCGSSKYYKALVINDKKNWNHETVYCLPNDESDAFLVPVGEKITPRILSEGTPNVNSCDNKEFYLEAWMEYDGELAQVPVQLCEQRDDIDVTCEPINESANAEPPIRIFNPDYPAYDEQGLQFLAADKGDRDKVFNFSCSEFTQVVSSSGENKAWTVRTSSAADPEYAFITPPFFSNNTSANLQLYGRQRNGIPYGAATFDANYDLLNSGPVYLQNQYYQKNDIDIFAGRPYGCSGDSCANVGYCSENPNVMCVYYPDPNQNAEENAYHYVNTKTCSDGGFGVCQPLWSVNRPEPNPGVSADNVLNQIFKESYGTFEYRNGNYVPGRGLYLPYNGGERPRISNVELYTGNSNNKDYSTSGVYRLEFNTRVDAEQQPLKMIYIDWGDDSEQAITGSDHRPDSENRHVFYHYYQGTPNVNAIEIRVWDNWDQTDSAGL